MSELIRFECPQCRKSLSAKPEHAGKSTKCPQCQCLLKVPSPVVDKPDFFRFMEAAEPATPPSQRNPVAPAPSSINDRSAVAIDRESSSDSLPSTSNTASAVQPPGESATNGGGTKPCPFCSEIIFASAKKCKHCGEFLDPVLMRTQAASVPPFIQSAASRSVSRQQSVTTARPQVSYTSASFRKLSQRFVWSMGGIAVFPLFGLVLFLVAETSRSENISTVAAILIFALFFVGIPYLVAAGVIQFILLYRYWSLIQDGTARTTPGKAVGFCFIPFFNFYWWYVAYVGLAEDMNRYCDERQIASSRISTGLALAFFILSLFGAIPYVNLLTLIPTLVILCLLLRQFTEVAIGIVESRAEATTGAD